MVAVRKDRALKRLPWQRLRLSVNARKPSVRTTSLSVRGIRHAVRCNNRMVAVRKDSCAGFDVSCKGNNDWWPSAKTSCAASDGIRNVSNAPCEGQFVPCEVKTIRARLKMTRGGKVVRK